MDRKDQGYIRPRLILRVVLSVIVGYLLGLITFVDYFGYGVLMALTFYLFHEYKYGWAAELVIMVYVNWELILLSGAYAGILAAAATANQFLTFCLRKVLTQYATIEELDGTVLKRRAGYHGNSGV